MTSPQFDIRLSADQYGLRLEVYWEGVSVDTWGIASVDRDGNVGTWTEFWIQNMLWIIEDRRVKGEYERRLRA